MKSSHVIGVLTCFCSTALSGTILPIDLDSWYWHRAVTIGSWLYVDGGEANDGQGLALASTLAIDLRQNWNNATIPSKLIDKPSEYPLARRQILWADESPDKIYAFGGWPYWDERQSVHTFSPPLLNSSGVVEPTEVNPDNFTAHPQTLWTLQLDGEGGGQWTSSSDLAGTSITQITVGSSSLTSNTTIYSAGGQHVNADWGGSETPGSAVPGLSSTSIGDAASPWKNSSKSGFSIGAPRELPWIIWGEALYSSAFGDDGVIIYFGDYSPTSQVLGSLESSRVGTLWNMSSIVVYDIATEKWAKQTAQGDIPPARWAFCSVGVSDAARETMDIFIYGGSTYEGYSQGPQPDLSNVYVLTLPSFVWTKLQESTTNVGRAQHSCAVIGQRQMAVIGGVSTTDGKNASDPWENGIGIFDMSKLAWADQFIADAPPYERNSVLQQVSIATPTPQTWDSPEIQQVFNAGSEGTTALDSPAASSVPTSDEPQQPTPQNGESKRTPAGAIAGGVIGGLVGLLVIGVAILLVIKKRRAKSSARSDSYPSDIIPRCEMDGRKSAVELQAAEKPVEKDAVIPVYELDPDPQRIDP